jgi:Mg-chelatase subunit ChlD
MLALSLAFHACVAAGIALAYFHKDSAPLVVSPTVPPSDTVMLLHSMQTPVVSQPARTRPLIPAVIATSTVPLPVLPLPVVEKTPVISLPATAAVVEANPNARVRAIPPDAVLSPSPAPHLNSADGIVFILDISGSMYEPYNGTTRLALAREILSRQILALKDGTPFAVTLYALRATTSGPLVVAGPATREAAVRFVMRDVDCGGGTNLPAGLASAGQLHPGALIVVTDGDLNMSSNDLTTKAAAILGSRDRSPNFNLIGIAPRINAGAERLMQKLTDYVGGTYQAAQFTGQAELVSSAANVIKPAAPTP